MLKAETRLLVVKQGARALAALVFLYFLSAFIQTGYVTPLQAIVGVLWLLICYTLSRMLGITTVLALSFAGSILWGILLESVPVSDYLTYHNHAARLSSGEFSEIFRTKSPLTVGYYAIFHWILGSGYATNYIASAIAWTGGAALIYKAFRPFVDDEGKAKFICFGLALCPAFVVFSPVISSESVYFLLSAVCAWLISRHLIGSGPFPYLYMAVGLVTAALFLTRTNGALAIVVCLFIIGVGRAAFPTKVERIVPVSDSRRSRQPLALCAIVVASFISVWFAHAQLSWLSGYGFQVTASSRASVYLLFGTNLHAEGRYNIPDLELAGYYGENKLPPAEADKRARRIVIERITSDPVGFARFALTDKVGQLWGKEHGLYLWAAGGGERGGKLNRRVRSLVFDGLDGVYRLTFLLFLILLIIEIRRPSPLLALGVIAFLFSLPHVLLEVQPRYHLAMTPFIIAGSMLLAHDIWNRRAEWYAAVRRQRRWWPENWTM